MAGYEQRTGYNPIYSEVSDYRKSPRRAPKAIDYLNWNGKGGNDLLVQVFGPTDAWYEAICSTVYTTLEPCTTRNPPKTPSSSA